ncbi:MAG TPA: SMC-Scp complex subunit ScpB [Puia sp.]|jgi:segregation and condensation protein B
MEIGNIIPHIEALIFASDKPLTSMEITELINNAFGFMEEKLTLEQIQTSIDGIREKYGTEFYPFEVRESGGGWQFLTKKDFHKTVAQLNGEKFLKRLSTAALETLSIVAYKQPITKGEIEAIRGVSSDYSIQKLLEKELIIIAGRNEEMPGKPLVYTTSKTFMDYFGINSPMDLPKLKEIFAETLVEPTIINHSSGELASAEEDAEAPFDEKRPGDEGQGSEEEPAHEAGHADEAGQGDGAGHTDEEVKFVVNGNGQLEHNEDENTTDENKEDEPGTDKEDEKDV